MFNRRRCRMFPSLVNCCTIDWFTKWPPEALRSVAQQCLQPLGDEKIINMISTLAVSMHQVFNEIFFIIRHLLSCNNSKIIEIQRIFEKKKLLYLVNDNNNYQIVLCNNCYSNCYYRTWMWWLSGCLKRWGAISILLLAATSIYLNCTCLYWIRSNKKLYGEEIEFPADYRSAFDTQFIPKF